jgi:RNA recognition motif-containing protein
MLTLAVRGLPRSATESTVTELFTRHGKVHKLKIAKDLFSGECKGFAEIDMEGHEARAAITALDGSSFNGAAIRVSLASENKFRRGVRR